MSVIRSISGLRATLGDDLTPELAIKYAAAFAESIDGDTVVLGRDGRPSGLWLENIIIGVLNACEKKVINLGMVPTPMVQLYTEHTNAAGGIAITASHNPKQWNGMKFINSSGVFLNKAENENLWDILDNEKYSYKYADTYPSIDDKINRSLHIDLLLQNPLFTEKTIEAIRAKKLKVCVDAVNASGSFIIPEILRLFNCEVIECACDGTGLFPHTPEPIPENLISLSEAVKRHKADLGVAVDPDADRLVITDENGVLIGEERTITLTTESVLSDYKALADKYDNTVVVNYSTTRAVQDVAEKYGAKIFRSPVGEINVVGVMKEKRAVIGGEGSGGVILPSYHYGRDSVIGTALILKLIAEKNQPLSEINAGITQYAMIKKKVPLSGDVASIIEKVAIEFADAQITKDDGIRIDFENSWVQLRASNTEPIMRIIAEAEDEKTCEMLIAKTSKLI